MVHKVALHFVAFPVVCVCAYCIKYCCFLRTEENLSFV